MLDFLRRDILAYFPPMFAPLAEFGLKYSRIHSGTNRAIPLAGVCVLAKIGLSIIFFLC